MKFTDEDKSVREFSDGNYFDFGVHKVTMGAFTLDTTTSGKEFIEVTVLGENGEEDTARVWFTTPKAANYSFNTFLSICVHNTPEDKREAVRATFDALAGTEELLALLNDKMVGKQCWFTKYYDAERTYTNQNGDIKRSVNKNITGYEPKLKPELMPQRDVIAEMGGERETVAKGSAEIPAQW